MMRAAEQDRPDIAEARTLWRAEKIGLDARRLVFIDETWATTKMTRLYGRAPQGQRVVGVVPHGHWKTTTLVAALDVSGVRCSMLLDGAVNRLAFEAFVQQVLLPTLKPDDLVVMDNLSSHKGPQVRELIRPTGAEVAYLPACSPDLNPIELAFSKLKHLLRSAGHRTAETLWSGVQPLLDRITPSDCLGFFQHCGYSIQMK